MNVCDWGVGGVGVGCEVCTWRSSCMFTSGAMGIYDIM